MSNNLYARALRRAAQVLGGTHALAETLGVSPGTVKLWMEGIGRPSEAQFLLVVDIIEADMLKNISRAPKKDP